MKRGPKPQPSHLKLIKGNPGKRAIPQNEPRPQAGELPDAPEFLTKEAREEWDRVSIQLFRMGMLTAIDVATLGAYCQAYGRWVIAERVIARMAETDQTGGLMVRTTNGNAIQNPLVGTSNKAASDMVRYAAEFGLTPAARARLALGPIAPQKSKFDGLIG